MLHSVNKLPHSENAPGAILAKLCANTLDALLPKRCLLCDGRISGTADAGETQGFCNPCRRLLPWIMTGCETCGTQIYEVGVCGQCQSHQPSYDHAVIPFKYREPVAAQIKLLKYRDQLRHAQSLGAMICQRVWQDPHPLPEVIIPVPLHRARLRQRGFNQALEIARVVGKALDIEVSHHLLQRIKNTRAQTGLDAKARARNVKGAFAAAPLHHAHIALVDDVVTSGSTANAAANALKKAGVQTVSIWAAARTCF